MNLEAQSNQAKHCQVVLAVVKTDMKIVEKHFLSVIS
jgi:hypothetical protein